MSATDPRFADSAVPTHIRAGLVSYVDHGIRPGGFLQAVVSNDLAQSCAYADDVNRPALFHIVAWLSAHAPLSSWGSPALMESWIDRCERKRRDAVTEARA